MLLNYRNIKRLPTRTKKSLKFFILTTVPRLYVSKFRKKKFKYCV